MNLYEQQDDNKRWTWIMAAAYVGLLALLGLGFDRYVLNIPVLNPNAAARHAFRWPLATTIALAVGCVMSLVSYFNGPSIVLASAKAREANGGVPEEKRLINVVSEMAAASGLPMPKVCIVPDPGPNAFATGTDPSNSSIAVTEGLLRRVTREELQGVIGHEMSHIRNYDVRLMTVLAALAGAIALLNDWAGRSYYYGGSRRRSGEDDEGGGAAKIFFLAWIILMILAPIVSQLLAMAVSRKREYLADASGAELTRNPLALASALEKIARSTEPQGSLNHGLAHLCIADPKVRAWGDEEGFVADLLATHPPIQARIATLKAMAGQPPMNLRQ